MNVECNLGMNILVVKDYVEVFLMVEIGCVVVFVMDDILLFLLVVNFKVFGDY